MVLVLTLSLILAANPSHAQIDPVTETLRERLDQLQASGRVDVGMTVIVSRSALPLI